MTKSISWLQKKDLSLKSNSHFFLRMVRVGSLKISTFYDFRKIDKSKFFSLTNSYYGGYHGAEEAYQLNKKTNRRLH